MNRYDSGVVASLLVAAGHVQVKDPAQAEVYLINSCSVREHAEERLFKRLAELAAWKRSRPERRIGLLGCTAQGMGERALEKASHLDLIAGPKSYGRLLSNIERMGDREAVVDIGNAESEIQISKPQIQNLSAFVAVSRGCDNRCSYCIVPTVRGPERSRPAHAVLNEVCSLIASGTREVVLLGQNVNSYRDPGAVPAYSFADLLRQVDEIPGIVRVGFLTSHPKDLSEDILKVMAGSRHIAHHLHLPLQSGSDRILAAMNRQYSYASYLARVGKAREIMPNLKLTTDLITGFPGESEEDFEATLAAIREIQFDETFTFYYSEREGTPAAFLPGPVPLEVRKERLARMIALTSHIASEAVARQVGKEAWVFVEGPSRKDRNACKGRTRENREVVLESDGHKPGDVVKTAIQGSSGRILLGTSQEDSSDIGFNSCPAGALAGHSEIQNSESQIANEV